MFSRKRDPLDDTLGRWSKDDPLTVRDVLRSVAVFGQTGSGKSSGSGLMFARAIVNYRDSGGLILASKPEDKEWWMSIFAQAGRKDDLLVMEPGGKYRCNILDYEMKHGADTRELTQFMMTVQETVNRTSSQNTRDPFWPQQNQRKLHNAMEIVKRASGKLDPWELQIFINDAATSPAVLRSPDIIDDAAQKAAAEKFQNGFHMKALRAAFEARKDEIAAHDVKLATQYWLGEEPNLDVKTRSNINAGVMGILHVYNTGVVRHLLATDTNISPDAMNERKWIMVNMPIVAGDASATFVNTAMKYLTQRHVLRRKATSSDPIIPIYCDEFPKVANSYDTAFLAECRSHKGCMITLAQSMPGMCEALGADEQHAHSLLCNQYAKVFHLLGEAATASFASSLLGNERKTTFGGTIQPESFGEQLYGRNNHTSNFNEHIGPVLEPSAFLGGLRTGGAACKYMVDGILIREGFYRFVSFSQRS